MDRYDYQQQLAEQERREQEENFVPWLRAERLKREQESKDFYAENARICKASRDYWKKWGEQWR